MAEGSNLPTITPAIMHSTTQMDKKRSKNAMRRSLLIAGETPE